MADMLAVVSSSTGSVPRVAVFAAWISTTCGGAFAILLGALHLIEPEYDPSWRFISEYALGQFGWIMTLAFVAIAANLGGVALVAATQLRGVVGRIGLLIIVIAVVGFVIAAAFKTDPMTIAPGEATFSGKMHVIGASLDFTPLGALLVSVGLSRIAAWRPVQAPLFFAAFVAIGLTALFMVTLPPDGNFGPSVHAGVVGRFLLLSYLGWTFTVAWHAIRLNRQEGQARKGRLFCSAPIGRTNRGQL